MELIKKSDIYLAAHVFDPRIKTTNIKEQYGDKSNVIIKRIREYLKKEYLKPGASLAIPRPEAPFPKRANIHAIGLLRRAYRNREALLASDIDRYLDSEPID
jgi:hypothetical protein